MASYQPVTKEIVEQLEKIAPGRVYFGDDVNPDYGRDEMPIYGTRDAGGVGGCPDHGGNCRRDEAVL